MSEGKYKIKVQWIYIIPSVHFLLSFIYERFYFKFNEFSVCYTEAVNPNVISDRAEYVLTYVLTKLCGAIIIFLFWRLMFAIFRKEIKAVHTILFGIIYVITGVVLLLSLPDSFGQSIDNYITYAYATRFIPFYWHHIFTGCIYGGILQAFPHVFAIGLVQLAAVVSVVGYIFIRLEKCFQNKKWISWTVLGIFALPETYVLITNPYRIVIYTIFCLLFMAIILLDGYEQRELSITKITILVVLASLISLWRSEGLILGIFGLAGALIFAYRVKFPKLLIIVGVFILTFVIVGIPQKLGQKKYYGNDYLIVSTLRPVQYILNSTNGVLDYEGGEDDLEAINAIVPIDMVRQGGLVGYMTNNRQSGREDVDQSFASEKAKTSYIKAYVRMVFNYPKPYLVSQLNYFYLSLGVNYQYDVQKYISEKSLVGDYWLSMWDQGQQEYLSDNGVVAWKNNSVRSKAIGIFGILRERYLNFLKVSGFFSAGHVLALLVGLYIAIYEFILFCKKKRTNFIFGYFALLWLIQVFIIILAMPYSYDIYMYPFIFSMYLLAFLYFTFRKCGGE